MRKVEELSEIQSSPSEEEPEDLTSHLPLVLRNVIDQPWFPKTSLVGGVTVEDILGEMITMMSDCAPFTYGRICDELLTLLS